MAVHRTRSALLQLQCLPLQVELYLAGSPVVKAVKERYSSIQKEYEELDTVWFMAGSLFQVGLL